MPVYLTALLVMVLSASALFAKKPEPAKSRGMVSDNGRPVSEAEAGRYITQSYFDSLYNTALYRLQASIEVGALESQQRQAIAYAQNTVELLKRLAVDNRNRNYILWKASELEGQIVLEEDDIFMRSSHKDEKLINKLIDQVNVEISRRRTDFVRCDAIANQLRSQSPSKAEEVDDVLVRRGKIISHEILQSAEKFLALSDIDMAYQELKYCERNRRFLTIAQAQFSALLARVEARDQADLDRYYIDTALVNVFANTSKLRLKEARTTLVEVRARQMRIDPVLPRDAAVECRYAVDSAQTRYDAVEDSLVACNFDIFQKKGSDAALAHKEKVLKKAGLSKAKLELVDNAILYGSPHAPAKKSRADTLTNEVVAMAQKTDDGSSGLNDLMAQARRKARAKADSVALYESARRAHEDSVEVLIASLPQQVVRENRKKAETTQAEIYELLSKQEVKSAYEKLTKKRRDLSIYLFAESYEALCRSVEQSYRALKK